jgi:hypothetical protein
MLGISKWQTIQAYIGSNQLILRTLKKNLINLIFFGIKFFQ